MTQLTRNLFDIEILVLRCQQRIATNDLLGWKDLEKVAEELISVAAVPQTPKFRGHLSFEREDSGRSTPGSEFSASKSSQLKPISKRANIE